MDRIPFSIYDFFGYLATGFIILVTVDFAMGNQWVLQVQYPLGAAFFWIIITYVLGNINANIASWIIERLIVGKILGTPLLNLMPQSKKKRTLKSFLFPGYYTPLQKELFDQVITKAKSYGIQKVDDTLFHHMRTIVKNDEKTSSKLDTFLVRYGFSRNMSLAFFIAFIILVIATYLEKGQFINYGLLALFGSVGMFYRYLKFFRQYTFELVTTYPNLQKNKTD